MSFNWSTSGLVLLILLAFCACDPSNNLSYKTIGGRFVLVDGENRIIDDDPLHKGGMVAFTPIIDDKARGFDRTKYETDLSECRVFAGRIRNKTVDTAVSGALVGAALGATVGQSISDPGQMAAVGAEAGAISGLAAGNSNTGSMRAVALERCLNGRGYTVLGIE